MKLFAAILAGVIIFTFTGPAAAGRVDFYSKLELPLYRVERGGFDKGAARYLYVGSDRSYAAAPKEVRVAGRGLSLGFAIAGLLQPLGPVMAAGFLLIGAYNAKQLAAELSAPAERSEYDYVWARPKKK